MRDGAAQPADVAVAVAAREEREDLESYYVLSRLFVALDN